jgi:hypothetical protein
MGPAAFAFPGGWSLISGRPPFGGLPGRAVAPLSQSEEGCHSALFHTTIHFGHHLLFYKDGGWRAGVFPCDGASIAQIILNVNGMDFLENWMIFDTF